MWTVDLDQLQYPVSDKLAIWLSKPLRLACAMRTVSSQVTVQLIHQGLTMVQTDDSDSEHQIWQREVLLCGDGEPWCFARIYVPQDTYQFFKTEFDALGEGLLGDTFLYQQSDIQRSVFEFAAFPSTHPYISAIPDVVKQAQSVFFARRSHFLLQEQCSLTVMECFFDNIPVLQEVSA